MSVRLPVALAATLVALALPAAAGAAVGATTVAVPVDGTLLAVGDGPGNVGVEGTAPGAADTDKVDVWCLRFIESDFVVAQDVPIAGEAFEADINDEQFPGGTCRILALPDGTPRPATPPAEQQGPLVTFEWRRTFFTDNTAADPGLAFDHFVAHQQARGYGDYDSISSCGLCDTKLFFAGTGQSGNFVHFGNGFFNNQEEAPFNRAGARVDGRDAWGSAVRSVDVNPGAGIERADTLEGLPPLTLTVNGGGPDEDMEILEEQDLVRCRDGDSFPLDGDVCGRFIPSGVRVFRRVLQTRDGLLFLVFDRFRSMDGAAHELDLHWTQAFRDPSSADEPGFQFPWTGDAYSSHDDGDTVPGTSELPVAMYMKSNISRPDGDTQFAQGLVMFDRPVGELRFIDDEDLVVPTTATVPAAGEVTVRHAYAIAATRAELVEMADLVEDMWVAPSVEFTTPAEGATVNTAQIDVSGRATDDRNAPALTLNGAAVPVGAGGAWTARVTLLPGPNVLTAVVRDAHGNEATAMRRVTFSPPVPGPGTFIPPDVLAPELVAASLSRTRFAVGPRATALIAAAKRGTRVRYTLSEAATVTFAISRRKTGRRAGGRCRKPTRANRGQRRCFRFVRRGRTITRGSPAGRSVLRFSGRIGPRPLGRGRYRMALVATDAAGNASEPRRLAFRIVRP